MNEHFVYERYNFEYEESKEKKFIINWSKVSKMEKNKDEKTS